MVYTKKKKSKKKPKKRSKKPKKRSKKPKKKSKKRSKKRSMKGGKKEGVDYKRYRRVEMVDGKEKLVGYYKGSSPSKAAKNAGKQVFIKKENNKEISESFKGPVTVTIQQITKGPGKGNRHSYKVTREKYKPLKSFKGIIKSKKIKSKEFWRYIPKKI